MILVVGGGRADGAGLPGSSTSGRSCCRVRLGGQEAVAGGPQVLVNSWVQAFSHGQCSGRCSWSRRAERAIRAGMLISWARIVAVVALAWKVEARAPAARVRLNAIAANTVQAELAANRPEGMCASGPPFRSAMTCSTIAWLRWVVSAASIGCGESVKTAWWR